jgi:hypothetical protein
MTAAATCDTTYVNQSNGTFTVLPTDTDDTANIQCAFDEAIAAGPGAVIQLVEGTYRTAQIVAEDFQGSFQGAGADYTVVQNLPNLIVTLTDLFAQPPTPAGGAATWPSILAFVGGDFGVHDLTVRAVGDPPTAGYQLVDFPFLNELAHGIVVLGPQVNVRLNHIVVEGEDCESCPLGFGVNLINAIFPQGLTAGFGLPQSGNISLTNSTIRNSGFTAATFGMENAHILISHNNFENVFAGPDSTLLFNTDWIVTHNKIDAFIGANLYGEDDPGAEASNILIANNIFSGFLGPVLEMNFGENMSCLLLGNNVSRTEAAGIILDEGIHDCTVVGSGYKGSIVDLGSNNVVVGINNQGVGVGPEVLELLRRFRVMP